MDDNVRLTDVRISRRGEWARLSGAVHQPWSSYAAPAGNGAATNRNSANSTSEPVELYFEVPVEYESWLYASGDAFLPALLPPAMNRGCELTIDAPVTRDMLQWAADFQGAYEDWYPGSMSAVKLNAPQKGELQCASDGNVALFFSQGVDSFYSLLKNMRGMPDRAKPITHLLYVEGIDTALADMQEAEATRAGMRDVAAAAGKKLIIARTNLRDHFPLDYGKYYSGPCLSAVAVAIARGLDHAMVAIAADYAYFGPSASNELVEGRVRIGTFHLKYDGLELNRLERITTIVGRDPIALRHLRVCTQNRSGSFNCGQCPKCMRTVVTLHLMGTLKNTATFPHDFSARMVRRMCIRGEWDVLYLREIYNYALATQPESDVTRELRRLFRIYNRWSRWQRVFANTPFRSVVPMADRWWQKGRELRKRFMHRKSESDVAAQVESQKQDHNHSDSQSRDVVTASHH